MIITTKTQLNMVIGYPLSHTLSPVLHNTVYQNAGIDAVFMAFPLENIEVFMQMLSVLRVGLIAVTMPFKERILPFLDERSAQVAALKAANTIIYEDGKLIGHNTDVDGLAYAFKDIPLSAKNVLIIGAGGAARAAAYFFKLNNASLFWHHRSQEKLLQIQSEFGGEIIAEPQQIENKIHIIINATPLGMFPKMDQHPLPNFNFTPDMIVFDMVYNPEATLLLRSAHKQGAKTISGLDMFVGQGIRQIELWTKKNLFQKEIIKKIKIAMEKALR